MLTTRPMINSLFFLNFIYIDYNPTLITFIGKGFSLYQKWLYFYSIEFRVQKHDIITQAGFCWAVWELLGIRTQCSTVSPKLFVTVGIVLKWIGWDSNSVPAPIKASQWTREKDKSQRSLFFYLEYMHGNERIFVCRVLNSRPVCLSSSIQTQTVSPPRLMSLLYVWGKIKYNHIKTLILQLIFLHLTNTVTKDS